LKISDDDKPEQEAQLKYVSKQDADENKRDGIKPLNCMSLFEST